MCGDVHPCQGPETCKEVCKTLDNENKVFNNRELHFIHVNVRSLLAKLEDIRMLAHKSSAACIGISETWLDVSV
jgi:hypothetical protein